MITHESFTQNRELSCHLSYEQWLGTASGRRYALWKNVVATSYLETLETVAQEFHATLEQDATTILHQLHDARRSLWQTRVPWPLRYRGLVRVILAAIILITASIAAVSGFLAWAEVIAAAVLGGVVLWAMVRSTESRISRRWVEAACGSEGSVHIDLAALFRGYRYCFLPLSRLRKPRSRYTRAHFAEDLCLGRLSRSMPLNHSFAVAGKSSMHAVEDFIDDAPIRLPDVLPELILPEPLPVTQLPPQGMQSRAVAQRYAETVRRHGAIWRAAPGTTHRPLP